MARFCVQLLIGYAMLIVVSGCASIVSGRKADVAFDSYPANAHVSIRDTAGRQVASLETPGVVSLNRKRKYFLPARYTATIEAPGYQPAQVPIGSTVNPWIVGNVILGGIPGLVVDTATGAVWRPRREEIHQQLAPLYVLPLGQDVSSATSPDMRSVRAADAQNVEDAASSH